MSLLDFNKAEFSVSYGISSQLPLSQRPEFVFSGRSNVGKSSLINKLCNRKSLARISSTPGKTGTINFYQAGEADLVDLPGYGYAKVSAMERRRWDELINGFFEQKRDIRLLVQLLDSRHEPSKDDIRMLNYINHHKLPFVVALTKQDKSKPSKWQGIRDEFEKHLAEYDCQGIFLTSAQTGNGIEDLALAMQAKCE